jgi:hypothetical protein
MSAAQDAAILFMVQVHNAEQKANEPVMVVAKVKESKPVPIQKQPKRSSMQLPQVGSLDARSFIITLRKANDRNEQIKAIHAFVGYDMAGDFGTQEAAARTKAQRELSGRPIQGMTRSESRAAARSMTGFVAGLPDDNKRTLANLRAREVAAVEAMLQHEKDAANVERGEAERILSAGLAEVERERLTQIRADIAAMGF